MRMWAGVRPSVAAMRRIRMNRAIPIDLPAARTAAG